MRKMGLIAGVIVLLGAALLVLFRTWPVINIVETGRTPEYPDVMPRLYPAEPGRVFDAALHAINAMPRWTLVLSQEDSGEIRAERKSRLWRFVDDVTIRVKENGAVTVVEARSASRVGRGDFGQNARNIRALFQELDRQMAGRDNKR